MPITVAGDDLNLKSVDWDHLLTEHGLAGCGAAMANGWQRKSKWFAAGDDDAIKQEVHDAFDEFRQQAKATPTGTVTLAQDANLRSVRDVNVGKPIGSGVNGNSTSTVRLVMEVKHSGDTHIVTAFPY
ncbi:hypothetical protein [Paraburkholderia rhizosphaerae]|uniref:Uncharacterized protein n=1 Tax=Paraburkholderia rhizosphaerae TaxID=480658 RepID=A0A4R8L4H7_9BURK|nr:hypothetical protein [Paraburkholderia rhizosphaerae]TDY37175.1 hypothetical protein BX592_14215 [Paraburkholderia rhizosphaerae]